MRGYRLATVAIWPVKYDAARRSLSIATRITGDSESQIVTLENYDTQPVLLKAVRVVRFSQ